VGPSAHRQLSETLPAGSWLDLVVAPSVPRLLTTWPSRLNCEVEVATTLAWRVEALSVSPDESKTSSTLRSPVPCPAVISALVRRPRPSSVLVVVMASPVSSQAPPSRPLVVLVTRSPKSYVLDEQGDFADRVNRQMVGLEKITDPAEAAAVRALIERHFACTNSTRARQVLDAWEQQLPRFVKIMPKDYQRMLACIARVHEQGHTGEEAIMAAFEENARDLSRVGGN